MSGPPPRRPLTALITGASSGIGEALAHCFARDGHGLVLVARNAGKLQALADALQAAHGTRVDVLPADLAQLEQGAFTAITAERHQALIALNVAGLTAMLSAFLPGMVRRRRGRVLNVASIAAFQPVPALACYAATKAYVLSLTEALAEELRGTGVSVGALCPGITATAMLDRAAARNGRLGQLPALVVGRVDDVAAEAYRACLTDTVITVPGVLNQTATLASRAAPRWLLRRLGGALGRKVL